MIKALDLFIFKLVDTENPYNINIVMERGEIELRNLIKKDECWDFFSILQLFKNILIGLTRMNLSKLTHSDLKPENVMKKGHIFYLADYGEGLNLFYVSKS